MLEVKVLKKNVSVGSIPKESDRSKHEGECVRDYSHIPKIEGALHEKKNKTNKIKPHIVIRNVKLHWSIFLSNSWEIFEKLKTWKFYVTRVGNGTVVVGCVIYNECLNNLLRKNVSCVKFTMNFSFLSHLLSFFLLVPLSENDNNKIWCSSMSWDGFPSLTESTRILRRKIHFYKKGSLEASGLIPG